MQNLIAFIKRLRYFLVFVGLQFFALSMYVSYMSAPRSSYFTTASYISGSLFEFRHQITQHFNLEKNNKSLQEENIALRKSSSVFLYNKLRTEAHVEDSIYAQQYDYIPGTILNATTTKRNNFFTLNMYGNKSPPDPALSLMIITFGPQIPAQETTISAGKKPWSVITPVT